MQLNSAERMLLELLQEKDEAARKAMEQRKVRFMASVAERLHREGIDIPLNTMSINGDTGEIIDLRVQETSTSPPPPPESAKPSASRNRKAKKAAPLKEKEEKSEPEPTQEDVPDTENTE